MAVADVAKEMTCLCREGKLDEAAAKFYSPDIVSIEAHGEFRKVQGMDAIKQKSDWWNDNFEVKGVDVVGPYINGDQFSVTYKFDATNKKSGENMKLEEIALNTVKGDKIVEECFFDKMA